MKTRPHSSRHLAGAAPIVMVLALAGCGTETNGAASPPTGSEPSSTTSTMTPTESPSEPPFAELTTREQDAVLTEALRTWQSALAEHLDPASEHLQTEEDLVYRRWSPRGVKPKPYETVPSSLALPKLGWRNAGDSGTGMVELTVFAQWNDAKYQMPCKFLETPCNPFDVDGARRGFHGTFSDHPAFGDGLFIAMEREDDTSIVITVSSLFGNNTEIPISGTGLTQEALVEAALDIRIALPQ